VAAYHNDEEQAFGQFVAAYLRQLDGREKLECIEGIFSLIHENKRRRLRKEIERQETQGTEVGFP
jgi:hypothetical protein